MSGYRERACGTSRSPIGLIGLVSTDRLILQPISEGRQPVLSLTPLAVPPEPGRLSRREIARLVGAWRPRVATLAHCAGGASARAVVPACARRPGSAMR